MSQVANALDVSVSPQDIEDLFQFLLNRVVGNKPFVDRLVAAKFPAKEILQGILNSEEFRLRQVKLYARSDRMSGATFRNPRALGRKPLKPAKVLVVGSCAIGQFVPENARLNPETHFEIVPFNNGAKLPAIPADVATSYDFQIVQIPIRTLMPEGTYMGRRATELDAKRRFEECVALLEYNLENALVYHRDYGIQTFVMNFHTPQQNPLGRLQGRYDLRNPIFFIEELNRTLYGLASSLQNVIWVDVEQISACLGKRYVQDDSVVQGNHGSLLGDMRIGVIEDRLEPLGDLSEIYSARVRDYDASVYDEILSHWRSLRGHEAIKMVIFDLDDTLWRGVAAEKLDVLGPAMTEGWPLGIVESAHYLWERGIVLAVASKNDDATIRSIWDRLYGHLFPFDRFAVVRANWSPKAENIAEILETTNILPESVVFCRRQSFGALDGAPGLPDDENNRRTSG